MNPRPTRLPAAVLAGLLATAAAGGASATAPVAGNGTPPGKAQSFEDMPDVQTPVRFTSNEGRFSVVFPSGCAKVRSRLRVGPGSKAPANANLVFTSCDREGRQNEGCSVTVKLAAARGLDGAAAAAVVLDHVREVLAGYDVAPDVQKPLRRDFGDHGVVEGLEISAHARGGAGDVCVRGLVHGDDVYILTAWKALGGMAQDPEYSTFFQSFLPWADADFMRGK